MLSRDQLDQPVNQATTVDPNEIKKFNELAEEWWKPKGKFRIVHEFNDARRQFILKQVTAHFGVTKVGTSSLNGLNILDVGCGAGLISEPLAAAGAYVVGIDAASKNIEIAKKHAVQSGHHVDYRHCLSEHVLETGELFDVVLNLEVIEHVADPEQLMTDCCHLLNPGGVIIIATLNQTIKSFLFAIVGAEYIMRWLPIGTHDWRRFFCPQSIIDMLTPHGLSNCKTIGLVYNPLIRRWRLTQNTSINYLLVGEKKLLGEPLIG
jgi:2-polyprenyl-6-hydroxyphenyl methylase/3-demethylubiquinone-9 3-methyltransferase